MKKKSPSRRTLLAKWSRQVRERDGNVCVVCGSDKFVQAHHLLPKERFPEFQFDIDNGLSLCARHHKFGQFSFHLNPIWAAVWLAGNRDDQWSWALKQLDNSKDNPWNSSTA